MRPPRATRLAQLPGEPLRWAPVRQRFESRALDDPAGHLLRRLQAALPSICAGDRVAVAVGSRGIAHIDLLVRTLVSWLRARGAVPYIVPAMGSHGGATAIGRAHVLEKLGIHRGNVAAEVVPDGTVVEVGRAGDVPVFVGAAALAADWVIPVARVKPHSDFRGVVESGACKMVTIGMGHRSSAEAMHSGGPGLLPDRILQALPVVLSAVNVPFAVAVVEDAFDDTALLELVAPERLVDDEARLLRRAAAWMPSLPSPTLDVLIVQEMGKNISGNGMDPNITGRFTSPGMAGKPDVARLAVLRLTAESAGNATGVGVADVVCRRLVDDIDWSATYTNHVAANALVGARLPLVAEDDEETVAVALKTLGHVGVEDVRFAWIRNTGSLAELMVSPALLRELSGGVTVTGPLTEVDLTGGDLNVPLPNARPPRP